MLRYLPRQFAGGIFMVYGNLENQQLEIEKFAKINGIHVDRWIEEKISGTKKTRI